MALSFIGKPISLISHSDVRYRGILAGIDPAASTIQLSNVFSMGTESRRPVAEYIPPVQEPYQYIIFRASEVKDLSVDEPPAPRRSVHDDPAVLGASSQAPAPAPAGPPPSYAQQTAQAQQQRAPPVQGQQQQPRTAAPRHQQPSQPPRAPQTAPANQNAIHTAAASLETVERALGDLRVSNANAAGNSGRRQRTRRNGGGGNGAGQEAHHTGGVAVPSADFDFESMNAKFDKAALAARVQPGNDSGSDHTNPSDDEDGRKEKEKDSGAYNPQKSFFDSLSSPPPFGPRGGQGGRGGGGGRGRGRGGYGFNRREEERERNVATFGEPGGVGLMGPGAYVGGWGGYGNAGRRGGPGRRRHNVHVQQQ
ncbi:Scd6-like Sm domain-containing protein [Roridomyces roridus]|uniref:Scd6-like Sm domain-containing protein n=1 Tax=Roridomyces roridus TaxID=1738132 RepID=A0AAD7C3M1_9AGAR|nr:Scd6-like Sm domain-containing protein [Roridomyces roridus]